MDGLYEIVKSIPEWVPWTLAGATAVGFMAHAGYRLHKAEKASRAKFDELAQSYSERMTRDELVSVYQELRKYAGAFIGKERITKRDELVERIEAQLGPIIKQEITNTSQSIHPQTKIDELSPTFKKSYTR